MAHGWDKQGAPKAKLVALNLPELAEEREPAGLGEAIPVEGVELRSGKMTAWPAVAIRTLAVVPL